MDLIVSPIGILEHEPEISLPPPSESLNRHLVQSKLHSFFTAGPRLHPSPLSLGQPASDASRTLPNHAPHTKKPSGGAWDAEERAAIHSSRPLLAERPSSDSESQGSRDANGYEADSFNAGTESASQYSPSDGDEDSSNSSDSAKHHRNAKEEKQARQRWRQLHAFIEAHVFSCPEHSSGAVADHRQWLNRRARKLGIAKELVPSRKTAIHLTAATSIWQAAYINTAIDAIVARVIASLESSDVDVNDVHDLVCHIARIPHSDIQPIIEAFKSAGRTSAPFVLHVWNFAYLLSPEFAHRLDILLYDEQDETKMHPVLPILRATITKKASERRRRSSPVIRTHNTRARSKERKGAQPAAMAAQPRQDALAPHPPSTTVASSHMTAAVANARTDQNRLPPPNAAPAPMIANYTDPEYFFTVWFPKFEAYRNQHQNAGVMHVLICFQQKQQRSLAFSVGDSEEQLWARSNSSILTAIRFLFGIKLQEQALRLLGKLQGPRNVLCAAHWTTYHERWTETLDQIAPKGMPDPRELARVFCANIGNSFTRRQIGKRASWELALTEAQRLILDPDFLQQIREESDYDGRHQDRPRDNHRSDRPRDDRQPERQRHDRDRSHDRSNDIHRSDRTSNQQHDSRDDKARPLFKRNLSGHEAAPQRRPSTGGQDTSQQRPSQTNWGLPRSATPNGRSEVTFSNSPKAQMTCSRCDKPGHTKNQCIARNNAIGDRLPELAPDVYAERKAAFKAGKDGSSHRPQAHCISFPQALCISSPVTPPAKRLVNVETQPGPVNGKPSNFPGLATAWDLIANSPLDHSLRENSFNWETPSAPWLLNGLISDQFLKAPTWISLWPDEDRINLDMFHCILRKFAQKCWNPSRPLIHVCKKLSEAEMAKAETCIPGHRPALHTHIFEHKETGAGTDSLSWLNHHEWNDNFFAYPFSEFGSSHKCRLDELEVQYDLCIRNHLGHLPGNISLWDRVPSLSEFATSYAVTSSREYNSAISMMRKPSDSEFCQRFNDWFPHQKFWNGFYSAIDSFKRLFATTRTLSHHIISLEHTNVLCIYSPHSSKPFFKSVFHNLHMSDVLVCTHERIIGLAFVVFPDPLMAAAALFRFDSLYGVARFANTYCIEAGPAKLDTSWAYEHFLLALDSFNAWQLRMHSRYPMSCYVDHLCARSRIQLSANTLYSSHSSLPESPAWDPKKRYAHGCKGHRKSNARELWPCSLPKFFPPSIEEAATFDAFDFEPEPKRIQLDTPTPVQSEYSPDSPLMDSWPPANVPPAKELIGTHKNPGPNEHFPFAFSCRMYSFDLPPMEARHRPPVIVPPVIVVPPAAEIALPTTAVSSAIVVPPAVVIILPTPTVPPAKELIGTHKNPGPVACKFHLQGICNKGSNCAFSHAATPCNHCGRHSHPTHTCPLSPRFPTSLPTHAPPVRPAPASHAPPVRLASALHAPPVRPAPVSHASPVRLASALHAPPVRPAPVSHASPVRLASALHTPHNRPKSPTFDFATAFTAQMARQQRHQEQLNRDHHRDSRQHLTPLRNQIATVPAEHTTRETFNQCHFGLASNRNDAKTAARQNSHRSTFNQCCFHNIPHCLMITKGAGPSAHVEPPSPDLSDTDTDDEFHFPRPGIVATISPLTADTLQAPFFMALATQRSIETFDISVIGNQELQVAIDTMCTIENCMDRATATRLGLKFLPTMVTAIVADGKTVSIDTCVHFHLSVYLNEAWRSFPLTALVWDKLVHPFLLCNKDAIATGLIGLCQPDRSTSYGNVPFTRLWKQALIAQQTEVMAVWDAEMLDNDAEDVDLSACAWLNLPLNELPVPAQRWARRYPVLLEPFPKSADPRLPKWKAQVDISLLLTYSSAKKSRDELKPRRSSQKVSLQMQQEVQKLRDAHFVYPAEHNPFGICSVALLIAKPDGKLRFTVNMKPVNALLRCQLYPLRSVEECLQWCAQWHLFAKLDLDKGFFNCENDATDELTRQCTCTIAQGMCFQWRVCAQGFASMPSFFQKVMTDLLSDIPNAIAYLDDIIIGGNTIEEVERGLDRVLARLSEYNFRINFAKCQFEVSTCIDILGATIRDRRIFPGPKTEDLLKKLVCPNLQPTALLRRKHTQMFLGLVNYFSKHMINSKYIVAPLYKTITSEPWQWGPIEQSSYDDAVAALHNLTPLHMPTPDPDWLFETQTDASQYGWAALLFQVHRDSRDTVGPDGRKLISIHGGVFNAVQSRWSIHEKECWALLNGIKKNDCFLRLHPVRCWIDNQVLNFLHKSKNDKVARWACVLQRYQLTLLHCAGTDNSGADPCSRLTYLHPPPAAKPATHKPPVVAPIAALEAGKLKGGTARPSRNISSSQPIDLVGPPPSTHTGAPNLGIIPRMNTRSSTSKTPLPVPETPRAPTPDDPDTEWHSPPSTHRPNSRRRQQSPLHTQLTLFQGACTPSSPSTSASSPSIPETQPSPPQAGQATTPNTSSRVTRSSAPHADDDTLDMRIHALNPDGNSMFAALFASLRLATFQRPLRFAIPDSSARLRDIICNYVFNSKHNKTAWPPHKSFAFHFAHIYGSLTADRPKQTVLNSDHITASHATTTPYVERSPVNFSEWRDWMRLPKTCGDQLVLEGCSQMFDAEIVVLSEGDHATQIARYSMPTPFCRLYIRQHRTHLLYPNFISYTWLHPVGSPCYIDDCRARPTVSTRFQQRLIEIPVDDPDVAHVPPVDVYLDGPAPDYENIDSWNLIRDVHNGVTGHPGIHSTIATLKLNGHSWPHMHAHVTQFISSCYTCQCHRKTQTPVQSHYRSLRNCEPIGATWSVDLTGGLPVCLSCDYRFIAVFVEHTSGFVYLKGLRQRTCLEITQGLIEIVGLFGLMRSLHSDGAREFIAETLTTFMKLSGIRHVVSHAHAPNANGIAERHIGLAKHALQMFMVDTSRFESWGPFLPFVQHALNDMHKSTIGTSSQSLVFGNRLNHPFIIPTAAAKISNLVLQDINHYDTVANYIHAAMAIQEALLSTAETLRDAQMNTAEARMPVASEKCLKPGTEVYIPWQNIQQQNSPPSGLHPKFRGPYIVVAVGPDRNSVSLKHQHQPPPASQMSEVTWSLHAGIFLADTMGIPASILDRTSAMTAIGTANGFSHRAIDCILAHRDITPFPLPNEPKHVKNFTYSVRWLEPPGDVTAQNTYESIQYSLAFDLFCRSAQLSGHTSTLFPFTLDTRARRPADKPAQLARSRAEESFSMDDPE